MKTNQYAVQPNISRLLDDEGVVEIGAYRGLIERPLTKHWDSYKRRLLQRKAWVFIGAYSKDVYAGIAVCDVGYVAKAFAYVYDVKRNVLLEDGITVPVGFRKYQDWKLDDDWHLKNYRIETVTGMDNTYMLGAYEGKEFSLFLRSRQNDNGLSFVCPSEGNRPFHFTYKNLLLPTQLQWTINGTTHTADAIMGSLDFSKGYPPHHTFWNWTSFVGQTNEGIPVGINLVKNFNNEIENALWFGDDVALLGKTNYDYQKPLEKSTWSVNTLDNNLDLKMASPYGARKERLNVGLLKSNFVQVYGDINGNLKYNGKSYKLNGYGVMEEHEAKW